MKDGGATRQIVFITVCRCCQVLLNMKHAQWKNEMMFIVHDMRSWQWEVRCFHWDGISRSWNGLCYVVVFRHLRDNNVSGVKM